MDKRILAFAGAEPRLRESGKWKGQTKISKSCLIPGKKSIYPVGQSAQRSRAESGNLSRRGEMTTEVKIDAVRSIDLIEEDINPGTAKAVHFWLDPAQRRAGLETKSAVDTALLEAEWHNRICSLHIHCSRGVVDAEATIAWLRNVDGQRLLGAICDGYETVWDDHNHIGVYDDAGRAAILDLEAMLDDCPWTINDGVAGIWDAREWFGDADEGIQATTTDQELEILADRLSAEAESNLVVLTALYAYLCEIRDRKKSISNREKNGGIER